MRTVIIIFFLSWVSNKVISQPSSMELDLRIDKVFYLYCSELVWEGNICITNNTNKIIVFPRSFDLELIITDSKGNILKENPEVMFEYKNLITLRSSRRLRPNHSLNIGFIESRVFAFPVVKNKEYSIQYSLMTNFYPDLLNRLGKEIIYSNKVPIIIP